MNTTSYKSLPVIFALIAVGVLSAWFSIDAAAISFNTHAIVAQADDGGCGDSCGGSEGGGDAGGGDTNNGPDNEVPFCIITVSPKTLTGPGDVTVSWESENATEGYIDGVGALHPPHVSHGSQVVHVTKTTLFSGSVWNPGFRKGTPIACLPATVTVQQPENGCVLILKETFDPKGKALKPVAQFTFTLDGKQTTQNDANGNAEFMNVAPGLHQVIEKDAGPTWKLLSVTPADGKVTVPSGNKCAAVVFKNQQVITQAPTCTLSATPGTINAGDSSTLKWTTTGATSFSIDHGVGSVTPVSAGSKAVSPPSTTTYTGTATGPGGTAQCTATVTVKQPQNGCILILKETFDPKGKALKPVAQFTFTLDGKQITQNDADGNAEFMNVAPGLHQVIEKDAGPTWKLLSVTPADGKVNVSPGDTCAAVVFKNQQVVTQGPSCTLSVNPATIAPGDSSVLSWTTANAVSFSIDHGIGSVTPVSAGSKTVSPPSTTTYTGTAAASNGATAQCSATVTVTTNHYGPYCGDGVVNQPWEQCDGTSQCNDKCQMGNQCVDLVLAKIDVTNVQNSATKPGNMTSDQFIGGSATANKIPDNRWFALYFNGHYYTDPDIAPYQNVPGLAIQRIQGKVRAGIFGSHTGSDADPVFNEHVEGNVQTWQANIVAQENDTSTTNTENPFENPTDGIKQLDSVQDEYWLSAGVSYFWASVNTANDFFYTDYQKPDQICGGGGNTPSCTLSVSASSITSGQQVTLSWTSNDVTSGFIDNNVGTTTPVSGGSVDVFPPSSTTYHGTFTGPDGTVQCSVPVTVITGCNGSCGGGGLNQPNVGLFSLRNPGQQPLAFVSLSQIPYTGFEAGPALTMIFWLTIALLSAFIAYLVVGGDGMRAIFASVLTGMAGIPVSRHEQEDGALLYGHPYPEFDPEERTSQGYSASVAAPSRAMPQEAAPAIRYPENSNGGYQMPVSAPQPQPAPVAPLPSLHDVIESRAHAAGVLMSPEALAAASILSGMRAETLRIFGEILNDAVRTIPRQDGWIMLTAEALNDLAARRGANTVAAPKAYAPSEPAPIFTPNPVSLDESAASAFAGAILSGDRESAFSIIRSLEHDKVSPTALMTSTASVLDRLYRARHDQRPAPDAALAEKAAHVSDEQLSRLVAVFTHSLDHVYASPFTGVKLALAQAFEALS